MKGLLTLNGRKVPYELTYKKVKHVNIRVRADGTVAVSANRGVTQAQIEGILMGKSGFILKALERFSALEQMAPSAMTYQPGDTLWVLGKPYRLVVEKGSVNRVDWGEDSLRLTVREPEREALRLRTMEEWYRKLCREVTSRLVREIQPSLQGLGVPVPEVKVRSMTSRWGSCKPSARWVTFARQLIEAPMPCVEYVVWHELVHFVHADHSAAFYGVLSSFLPDWKARRELLNSYRYRQVP